MKGELLLYQFYWLLHWKLKFIFSTVEKTKIRPQDKAAAIQPRLLLDNSDSLFFQSIQMDYQNLPDIVKRKFKTKLLGLMNKMLSRTDN